MTNGNGKEIKKFLEAPDEVDDNFIRESKNVPLIQMSEEFRKRSLEEQRKYWHKLASSLNDACQKIQSERDELNKILFKKEEIIISLHRKLDAEREMIQKHLMEANTKQQKLLEENQSLRKEIHNLESDHANKY